MSINVCTREEKDAIAELIGDFRFTAGFGRTLSRLVRHGIGVHHAGMLPKYRRLVEQLAQAGLLKVICGTDTLGVGINVPIRTVLFTGADEVRRHRAPGTSRPASSTRSPAAPAGPASTRSGTVVVQAPEHVVENEQALAKAGDDPKKRRKVVRKKPPEGFVSLGRADLRAARRRRARAADVQLRGHPLDAAQRDRPARRRVRRDAPPARRQPRDRARASAATSAARSRSTARCSPPASSSGSTSRTPTGRTVAAHRRPAARLRAQPAAVAVRAGRARAARPRSRRRTPSTCVSVDRVDPRRPAPGPVARSSTRRAGEAVAADEGRRHRVRGADGAARGGHLPEAAGRAARARRTRPTARGHPWVADHELSPKSVARDMYERAMTFAEYVGFYGLARSEGLVLRYLADAYKALRQTVPDEAQDRGAARPHRVARRAGPPGRLQPARRVGAAAAPGRRRPRRRAGASTTGRRRSPPTRARSGCWCATRCSAGSSWPRCAGATSSASSTPTPAGTPTRGREALEPYFDEHDDARHRPRRPRPARC